MSSDELLKKLAQQELTHKNNPTITYGKVPLYEIKGEGIFRFRIIGNVLDPSELPFETAYIHLGFTHPNFSKKVPLPCLGKNCPMCVYHRQKEAQGASNAWTFKCNQRFIYYALMEDMKVVLLSLTYSQQYEVHGEMVAYLKSGVNIMDLNAGRWIEITSRKINGRQKYVVNVEDTADAVPEEVRNTVRGLRPLKGYYKPYKEEDIKKIMRGEKIAFKNSLSSNKPDPEPSPEDKEKYKSMKSMVEKKPENSKKTVSDNEYDDLIDKNYLKE